MQEFHYLMQLLAMLIVDPRTGVLIALLIIAGISDYRSFRIPNWLTLGGMAFGVLYNSLHPYSPHVGFWWAFLGLLLGLLLMLPLYALGVMGAGDAKLMAMCGAFLGMGDTFCALLASFVVGGVAAIGYASRHRVLPRMFGNIRRVLQLAVVSTMAGSKPSMGLDATQSVGRMPYGVSISIGTIGYVVAKQLGYF